MPSGAKPTPQLPIEDKTSRQTGGSPRRRGGGGGGRGKQGANKAWADFTPGPWIEGTNTPTPWLSAVPENFGGYTGGGMMTNTAGTAPDGTRGAQTRGDGQGESYWPATPTPQAQGMMYDFNAQAMQGFPLGAPPPFIAAMAASAAGAAGAAAAAAAACPVHPIADGSSPESPPEQDYQAGQFSNMVHQQQQQELSPDGVVLPTNLPSKGSATHGTGKCRPCAWFWKQQGCQNALDCGYCHLCPEGELRSRKKNKVAAMRMGALAPAKPGNNNAGTARTLKLTPLV